MDGRKWLVAFGIALAAGVAAAGGGAVLVPDSGGGWRTAGLPYEATISAAGHLESLRAGGFEFMPACEPRLGLYLFDGQGPLPFAGATVSGDAVKASNEWGTVTVRFLAAGLEIAAENRGIREPQCLRMDVSADIRRIKSASSGREYDVPLRGAATTPARLMGAGGASLTFGAVRSYHLDSGASIVLAGDRHQVRFPPMRPGQAKAYAVAVAPAARPEDAVRAEVRVAASDFTFWTGAPQRLITAVSNVSAEAAFKGDAVLRVRSYLTKAVAKESRQRLTLKPGAAAELAWAVEGLEPMLYMAELWIERGGESGLCLAPRFVFNAGALQGPDEPDDFGAFWQRTLEEQAKIPLDLQMTKVRDEKEHEVFKFSFAGLLGHRCYGWLTVPKDKSRRWPGVLVLPPAGMRSQPVPLFPGEVGMRININTVDVDLPDEKYEWQTWPAPYLVQGLMDRDTYCLRFGYAATVRAAEVLAARPEVDPARVRVTGSSQGGGLTFICAGLYTGFASAEAMKPGLCRLDWNLDYLQPPYFPIAVNDYVRPEIAATLRYFEPTHFARRIRCPITASLGLHDDVTPSVGVFCVYNAIPGTNKALRVDAQGGH